jgi:hypothetical protein
LRRIATLLRRGLERTQPLWPDVGRAYRWLRAAAHILTNRAGLDAAGVQARYERLLAAWAARRDEAGRLAAAVDHFMKVTASYRPGLFHCYQVESLPRTNNALEQLFGAHRHHERRATGRKTAAPTRVLRGAVRLVAGVLTRAQPISARELAAADRQRWLELRASLERRRQTRVMRRRFRQDPGALLAQLEQRLLQPTLPP